MFGLEVVIGDVRIGNGYWMEVVIGDVRIGSGLYMYVGEGGH
jgi:hypothetical protein